MVSPNLLREIKVLNIIYFGFELDFVLACSVLDDLKCLENGLVEIEVLKTESELIVF